MSLCHCSFQSRCHSFGVLSSLLGFRELKKQRTSNSCISSTSQKQEYRRHNTYFQNSGLSNNIIVFIFIKYHYVLSAIGDNFLCISFISHKRNLTRSNTCLSLILKHVIIGSSWTLNNLLRVL